MGVSGIETAGRHHQADGIGTKYPHTGLAGRLPNRIHQRLAGFAVGTRHTAGHHNSGAYALLPQFAYQAGYRIRRGTDNGQVRSRLQMGDLAHTGHPVHIVVVVLVDHLQRSGEAATQKVPQHHTAQTVGTLGGTDHCNGRRIEQAFQITGTQAQAPCLNAEWLPVLPSILGPDSRM